MEIQQRTARCCHLLPKRFRNIPNILCLSTENILINSLIVKIIRKNKGIFVLFIKNGDRVVILYTESVKYVKKASGLSIEAP